MSASPGTVYLVGAGPGDPGLATVRAAELIARADVILYDRLVSPRLLEGARADTELAYVGKEAGGHTMSQEEINRLLVAHAKEGRTVVRLKGGDPFVFGRGGEEAEALVEAGVPFEVVPGVTAGVAAPAYAGIPVTHRDAASAVAFVTAHEDPAKPESAIDWAALAAFPGTLVFYMGVGSLPAVTAALQQHGRDGGEPAAVVERGTLPRQRTVSGTLADIAERAQEARVRPPAVTLVGSGRGLARAPCLVRTGAPARQAGGRHPGARAVQRPGGRPGAVGRGGRAGPRDQDRAAHRLGATCGRRCAASLPESSRCCA